MTLGKQVRPNCTQTATVVTVWSDGLYTPQINFAALTDACVWSARCAIKEPHCAPANDRMARGVLHPCEAPIISHNCKLIQKKWSYCISSFISLFHLCGTRWNPPKSILYTSSAECFISILEDSVNACRKICKNQKNSTLCIWRFLMPHRYKR